MTLPNIHELICLLYIGRCLNIHNTIDQRHTRSACQCFGHFIQKFLLILCISSTAICHTTDHTLASANRDNSNASGVKNFSDHCMGYFMYCNLLQLCGVGFLIRFLEFIYHLKKSFYDIFLLDVLMTLIDTIQRSKVHYRFQCSTAYLGHSLDDIWNQHIIRQIFIPEIVADNVLCILSNRRLQIDYIIKSTRSQQGWWHIPCIVSSSNHKKICVLCIINTGLQTSPFRRIGRIRFYIEVQIF